MLNAPLKTKKALCFEHRANILNPGWDSQRKERVLLTDIQYSSLSFKNQVSAAYIERGFKPGK